MLPLSEMHLQPQLHDRNAPGSKSLEASGPCEPQGAGTSTQGYSHTPCPSQLHTRPCFWLGKATPGNRGHQAQDVSSPKMFTP